MTSIRIAGIFLLMLGLGMLYLGGAVFTWQGPGLSDFVNEAGKYCFFLWFPTVIVAIVLIVNGRKKQIQ